MADKVIQHDKSTSEEKKDSTNHWHKELQASAGLSGRIGLSADKNQNDKIEKAFGSISITGLDKTSAKLSGENSTKAATKAATKDSKSSAQASADSQMDGSVPPVHDHEHELAAPKKEKLVEKQIDSPVDVSNRKTEIQSKYGVVFDTPETLPASEKSRYREPTLAELDVLDTALNKSREGRNGTNSSKPLNIAFFTKDKTDGALATHQGIEGGASRIIVRNDDLATVDGDVKDGKVSLGSVLMHELGHRADFVNARDDEKMGWKKIGSDQFALEANDGRLYKYVAGKDSPTGECYWLKVSSDGTPNDGQNDSRLSDSEMQEVAKFKQPMHPASHPAESFANSIRMYRQNEETRKELEEKSPEIYKYMQEYDQKQVRRMGTDFFGIPEYKREQSGLVTKNDRAWNPWLM